ncbi:hypothetical protein [Actinospongicola halichondriae]|uniref:hypothetical protein n=1 Tax=Actinospongicola halichondriae TaxID=3236844 RepID=UPI003D5C2A2E
MTTTPTTNRFRRRTAALVAFVLAISVPLSTSAFAQESPDDATDDAAAADDGPLFAVQPSGPDGPGTRDWFTYTLDPGDVFGDTVAVSNLSDAPIRFAITPTDAISVADTGGFAALKDPADSVGVGTWVQLAEGDYRVEPGERIDVPFSITVPEDAEPGDHVGAILALDADAPGFDPESAPEGVSFDVNYRLGARIYVRVGGPVTPALRIDDLSVERDGDQAIVTWEVENTGNLRLQPTAEVRVTGWFGRTVARAPLQELPELIPDANFVGATVLTGMPSFEPLTAHVVVTAPEADAEASLRFAPYPWVLLLVLLLLVIGAAWWLRRRRNRGRESTPVRPAQSAPRVPEPV